MVKRDAPAQYAASNDLSGLAPTEPAAGGWRHVQIRGSRSRGFILAIAGLLIATGVSVTSGWLLHVPGLVLTHNHQTSMVISTALCFLFMGLGLLPSRLRGDGLLRMSLIWLPPALTLLIAILNSMQLWLSVDTGINFAWLHAWRSNHSVAPGQMAEATTVAFLFAAASLLAFRLSHSGRVTRELARGLAALVILIGGMAAIGYASNIESLYSWYTFSRMAPPTAIGTTLLGIALWMLANERGPRFADERQVVAVGTSALVLVAIVTALVAVTIFRTQGEQMLGETLSKTRMARADILLTMLELRSDHASLVSTRGELMEPLRALLREPGNAAARRQLAKVIADLQPYGFTQVSIDDARGRSLIDSAPADPAGDANAPASVSDAETSSDEVIEIPIRLDSLGEASLVWHHGFVLRNRNTLREGGLLLATVVTEQPLRQLATLLAPTVEDDRRDETVLCGYPVDHGTPRCFTSGQQATGDFEFKTVASMGRLPADVLSGALDGGAGISTIRAGDGIPYALSIGPVGLSGLAVAVLHDSSGLFAPLRRGLIRGLLIVLAVTLFGVVMLRTRIAPLVRKLSAVEGRYQTVVRSMREGLVLQGHDNRILASNPAASSILGLTEDQMLGRTSADRRWMAVREDGSPWPGEDHPSVRTLRSGVAETDVIMGVNLADGVLRWLSVNTTPVEDIGGSGERGVVVSFEDITARRNAESLSRQLEQRFRLLVENVADYGIFMLGLEGTVVSWNRGAENILGYSTQEIIGRHFSCLYPSEDRVSGKPERDLIEAGSTGRFAEEDWRVRKEGFRFRASIVITEVCNEQGRRIGFAQVTRDLSARLLAEQQVAEANRLRDAMLENAPYAIIATDPRGIVTAFNPAAERILGYRAEDMIGRATPELIHDRSEVMARARELSEQFGTEITPGFEVFVHKAREGITEEREWTYIRSDGTRIPVQLAVSSLRDDKGEITGFLGLAHDITERKRREEYTRHVAQHDFLTGLPNRLLLKDRLDMAIEHARRNQHKVAVLMMDLDHFKRVNDSLGHPIGDELLKIVAARVSSCVRVSDTVARMGGDEFVIVLGQIHDSYDAERIAAMIVETVSASIQIGPHELVVTPSVGIGCFPDDGEDTHLLLKCADSAMYRAKASGRRGWCTFNHEMSRVAQARLELENAIHRALRNNEFRLHYQPQICLDTGSVIGMEALLRWDDPVLGPVSPADFITVAEECGLIGQLGEWVLRTACIEGRALQLRTGHDLRLAVNLSARQFRGANLVELIRSALDASGLDATRLELEITEGVLMSDTEETVRRLNEIRSLGVTIAIDDFGVGFSSLSYITRFPFDTLKIDRSFIANLPHSQNDAAVTQAVIALGRSLGITVVAEGVETLEQLEFLRERHCDAAQGFLLGRPTNSAQFSVQGFCFGKAVSAEAFANDFEALSERGRRTIRRSA